MERKTNKEILFDFLQSGKKYTSVIELTTQKANSTATCFRQIGQRYGVERKYCITRRGNVVTLERL